MNTLLTADEWQAHAACRSEAPETFFPRRASAEAAADAKTMCSRCPVQPQCLQWARETRQEWGVWGGLSEDERRKQFGWGPGRTVIADGFESRAEQIAADSEQLQELTDKGLTVFEIATTMGTNAMTIHHARELLAARGETCVLAGRQEVAR